MTNERENTAGTPPQPRVADAMTAEAHADDGAQREDEKMDNMHETDVADAMTAEAHADDGAQRE
ncbi:MAG: hypothetical protein HN341_17070, partial [Verrucomicrobia bacterium]|nr:hypothetical protein [Verrucomicrobiota bacterium]